MDWVPSFFFDNKTEDRADSLSHHYCLYRKKKEKRRVQKEMDTPLL